ncbi:PGF-pre-PGF domain-containing protein [Methanosarcina sp.]|uniref:PGF-pre-PGF domain-containing protein n=1 Tax=Methanosarcina sp. TaxID=2213 RepID=UPI002ABB864A|nr:PGF-pre-PGF domain-containing protein [Methanosarcina sp.]MDY9927699.1 PGF-pre-PGF domain-containing protein [Methanosarcina sp.]
MKGKTLFIVFTLVFLMGVPSTVSARDIIVGSGSGQISTIQEAVDGAEAGDVIIIKPGTYVENINVSKARLTIKPETNNVFIEPADSTVATIILSNVGITLTGFNIDGSVYVNNALLGNDEYYLNNMSQITNNIIENGGVVVTSESSGIVISENRISGGANRISGGAPGYGIDVACCGDYNEITNNEVSNCSTGIYVYDERNVPPISGNKISNCEVGIHVSGLSYDIENNEITNCGVGVLAGETGGANLIGNKITYCSDCGLKVTGSLESKGAYNNYFNNTVNVKFGDYGDTYVWNSSLTEGTNIIGGPYIGGNYWAKPDGTGFSQTAIDANGDGIADSAYAISEKNYDYLPLTAKYNSVLPVFDFTANVTSGAAPLVALFTYTGTGGTPTSWFWDFGDGINSKHAMNATHTFTSPGTYNVTLTVTNSAGNNSVTRPGYITVTSPSETVFPVADFYSPEAERVLNGINDQGIFENEVISFFDNSTGSPISWFWDFGDGNTSTQKNPTHAYGKIGGYTVNLTVKNANGSHTISKYGYVLMGIKDEAATPAYFSSDVTSGKAPLTVTFLDDLDAQLPNYPIWREWDFGDGTVQTYVVDANDSATPYATHTYEKPGKYTVTLSMDNRGGKSIITKYNYITVKDPTIPDFDILIVNFSMNVSEGYAPLSVQFSDLSENAVSRVWDFNNDGKPESSDLNPVYTYTVPGTYFVNLTITNANGTSYKVTTINVLKGSSSGDSNSNSEGSSSKSSGSSGGSGGGGGSPEPAKNVEVKELCQVFITNEKETRFDFKKNATCVVYASFDAKRTMGKTTAIAEMLKEKSSIVSELPSGEVYKSFNIWVGNGGIATSKNIENSEVCFRVEKSWMQEKDMDQTSITLNQYSDKKWEQLSADKSGEDDKFLYFTAKTPGFASFVITGETKSSSEENKTGVKFESETRAVDESNTGDSGLESESGAIPKESMSAPDFGIIYGLAGVFAVFLYRRK